MEVIVNKLVQFFLVLLLGYGLARIKMIQEHALQMLSQLVTKVFLPTFIFCSMYNGNSREQLVDGLPILFITLFFYLFMVAFFALLAKLLGLKGERRRLFQALFIFGNTGFVGTPIVLSLYGGEGAIYMALFSIIDQMILWSYGVWLCSGQSSGKFQLKNLLNPCMIAIIAAIVSIVTGIHIPVLLLDAAASVGNANIGVCMIYLGALLYYSNLRSVLKERELYIGIVVKMLVLPICAYAALNVFIPNTVMRGTLVILSALPTMTVIPILAGNGGSEGEYAASVTMVTLIVGLLTLPIVASVAL